MILGPHAKYQSIYCNKNCLSYRRTLELGYAYVKAIIFWGFVANRLMCSKIILLEFEEILSYNTNSRFSHFSVDYYSIYFTINLLTLLSDVDDVITVTMQHHDVTLTMTSHDIFDTFPHKHLCTPKSLHALKPRS